MDEVKPQLDLTPEQPLAREPQSPEPLNVKIGFLNGQVFLAITRPTDVLTFDPKTARRIAELIRQASHKATPKVVTPRRRS